MRRATTPAIPLSMYRHFAVITVMLTTGVAMFANGENNEAIARQLEAEQESTAESASAPSFGSPKPGRRPGQAPASFADDGGEFDSGFGRPMEIPRGGRGSSIVPAEEVAAQAGYSPAYLASLSPEERELLLKGLAENGMLSDEARRQSGVALARASARRSGAPGAGE